MSIILHISAGQGPDECKWVVAKLAEAFIKEAAKEGARCEPLEPITGPTASIMLRVEGDKAEAFAAVRTGTVRWIGTSPFRPTHKRKNWFVGVTRVSEIDDLPDLGDRDITYQSMRASGPGGQHVNKTESAIRATHVPSGLTATSQAERSQQANKKLARLKLALILRDQHDAAVAVGKASAWEQNHAVERGNSVRTYEGEKFKSRR